MARVLGLDLGPNSIGWALIEEQPDNNGKIVDCGARVFREGVENYDTRKESSRAEQRRKARLMRRRIRRRARRRRIVEAALVEARLLPGDTDARREVLSRDPIALRAAAVAGRLEPDDIGRVIYHLNQRRGFLSLKKLSKKQLEGELKNIEQRKTAGKAIASEHGDAAAKEENDAKMLAQIELLSQRLGQRTLGEELYRQQTEGGSIPVRVRGQPTSRKMIEDEFLRIWEKQKEYHPDLLTDAVCFGAVGRQDAQHTGENLHRDASLTPLQQFGLYGLIFHQRHVYWPLSAIGRCEYEPREKRCPRAHRLYQRYRILCDLNNLRFDRPGDYGERRPDAEQRARILHLMNSRAEVAFNTIRKVLGPFDGIEINLESMARPASGKKRTRSSGDGGPPKREKIKGHETDAEMRKAYAGWEELSESIKNRVVEVLVQTRSRADKATKPQLDQLCEIEGITRLIAEKLMTADLPKGFGKASLKFLQKVLPFLEQGHRLSSEDPRELGAIERAGYRSGGHRVAQVLQRLPRPDSRAAGALRYVTNPVVKRAMWELRRLVNTILREHFRDGSKPDSIYIEMGRSMKQSSLMRREDATQRKERERTNDRIREAIRELGVVPTDDAVRKYKLWLEQGEKCAYSGRCIPSHLLFSDGGEVQIDHILPQSRTRDDALSNLVVCYADQNKAKGNRLPSEWLDAEALKHVEVINSHLPWRKRQKLRTKSLPDGFTNDQAVDNSHVARAAVSYLQTIVGRHGKVIGRTGTHTDVLRRQWGLDTVLEKLPDSPAWKRIDPDNEQDDKKLGRRSKNRADHRHHTIDAIILALTSPKRLDALLQDKVPEIHRNKEGQLVETYRFPRAVDPPWGHDTESFHRLVSERIRSVNVSHSVRRDMRGALHKQKYYGPVHSPTSGDRIEGVFAIRKPVEELSMDEVEDIRDEEIKRCVVERLTRGGFSTGRKAKGSQRRDPTRTEKQELFRDLRLPSGVPIRKARIKVKLANMRPLRPNDANTPWVVPERQHRVALYEVRAAGKRTILAQYTDTMEAHALQQEPSAGTLLPGHPERRNVTYLYSLATGDLVSLELAGRRVLHRVSTLVSTQQRIHVVLATDARKEPKDRGLSPQSLVHKYKAVRVTVDPLGRVRDADARHSAESLDAMHPEILRIARSRISDPRRHPLSWVKREMDRCGLRHQGGQLSRVIRLLTAGST